MPNLRSRREARLGLGLDPGLGLHIASDRMQLLACTVGACKRTLSSRTVDSVNKCGRSAISTFSVFTAS